MTGRIRPVIILFCVWSFVLDNTTVRKQDVKCHLSVTAGRRLI